MISCVLHRTCQVECSSSAWKVSPQICELIPIFCFYVLYQTESSLEKPIFEITHTTFCSSLRACEKFHKENPETISTDFQLHKHHFACLFSSLRTNAGGKNVTAKEQDRQNKHLDIHHNASAKPACMGGFVTLEEAGKAEAKKLGSQKLCSSRSQWSGGTH